MLLPGMVVQVAYSRGSLAQSSSFNTCSHVLNDGVGLHFITFHMFDSDATIFYCCKMDETGVFSIVMTANSRWG